FSRRAAEDAGAGRDGHCAGDCRGGAAEVLAGVAAGPNLHVDVGSVDGRVGRRGDELTVDDGLPYPAAAEHVFEAGGQAACREARDFEVEVAAGLVLDGVREACLPWRLFAFDVARDGEAAEVAVVGVDDVGVAFAVDGPGVDRSACPRDGGSGAWPAVYAVCWQ